MLSRLRLVTGLVLFTYVTPHLLNAALGLVSLEAMNEGREWFLAVWRNPVGTTALYLSLVIHLCLAFWAIYARRSLRYRAGEAAQLALGLIFPLALSYHLFGTRGAATLAGTHDTYTYVLLANFVFDRSLIAFQVTTVVTGWVHGCIGLHYWLRLKRFYEPLKPTLYALAILLPVLALIGYVERGREVMILAQEPQWMRRTLAGLHLANAETARLLYRMIYASWGVVAAGIVIALLGRGVRSIRERIRGVVRVTYPDGRELVSPPGPSILDISRANGMPHACVCGGRGRCSTCRVRIVAGLETLAAPDAPELRVLDRIGRPVNVRLACQTHPTADVSVVPLLPPDATPRDAYRRSAHMQGQDREVAVMFTDLRAFTRFSEQKLPYDVVFVLNRYFADLGHAVERAGGHLDKFIGDGMMAVFGIDDPIGPSCRQALEAARSISLALDTFNRTLANELPEPFRIGIGIHAGPAIVGEMGYGAATGITAIGDTVNTASRLEAATKELAAELVFSEAVAEAAGLDPEIGERRAIAVRGRAEPVAVRVIAKASDLPAILGV